MLTLRELDVFNTIRDSIADVGVAPTYTEIMLKTGHRSKHTVHQILSNLEKNGFIKRIPYRDRGIEILKLPQSQLMSRVTPAEMRLLVLAKQFVQDVRDGVGGEQDFLTLADAFDDVDAETQKLIEQAAENAA